HFAAVAGIGHLDEALPACRDRIEQRVIAEAWYFGAHQLGRADHERVLGYRHLDIVDGQGDQVFERGPLPVRGLASGWGGRHADAPFTGACSIDASGGNNSWDGVCIPASNSLRKYWIADVMGLVAPSPSAQNARPRMLSHISTRRSISPSAPSPRSSRSSTLPSHQVPSRHGAHLPQDLCR